LNAGKILVIGSINMDLVVRMERMPLIGETFLGKDFQLIPGGKGANQAVAAARLGTEVAMIGCVGEDSFGKQMLQNLKNEGIRIQGIEQTRKASTGIASIHVDLQGQNTIVVVPGANYALTCEHIDKHKKLIEDSQLVMLQLEIPIDVVEYAVRYAKQLGKKVVLNLAPIQSINPEIFACVDYLVLNEVEGEALTGVSCREMHKLAVRLGQLGCSYAILTLGEAGAVLVEKGGSYVGLKAYPVRTVDTTAAGDSFVGGLGSRIVQGDDPGTAVQFGMKAAALTVTKLGAQSSLPTMKEIEDYFL